MKMYRITTTLSFFWFLGGVHLLAGSECTVRLCVATCCQAHGVCGSSFVPTTTLATDSGVATFVPLFGN
jgi:hypothetical protein